LLEPEERTLFRRLAPFRGCTLDALAAVCVTPSEGPRSISIDLQPLEMDARNGLASLVDKSLLHVDSDEHGQAWYVMLETVREFALERLEASPETTLVWRRHAWYYLQLAEDQTRPGPHAVRQDVFISRLEREHGNFRAALDWCQAHGGHAGRSRGGA
jgi:predicted ATPase